MVSVYLRLEGSSWKKKQAAYQGFSSKRDTSNDSSKFFPILESFEVMDSPWPWSTPCGWSPEHPLLWLTICLDPFCLCFWTMRTMMLWPECGVQQLGALIQQVLSWFLWFIGHFMWGKWPYCLNIGSFIISVLHYLLNFFFFFEIGLYSVGPWQPPT